MIQKPSDLIDRLTQSSSDTMEALSGVDLSQFPLFQIAPEVGEYLRKKIVPVLRNEASAIAVDFDGLAELSLRTSIVGQAQALELVIDDLAIASGGSLYLTTKFLGIPSLVSFKIGRANTTGDLAELLHGLSLLSELVRGKTMRFVRQ
jgi:hypothetical protein